MGAENPLETELAFTLLADRSSIENHRLFRRAEASSHRLLSTYFDTPSQSLGRAGWSVRLRAKNDRWEQTVKGPTKGASRPEWNFDLEAAPEPHSLNAHMLRSTPLWQMIDGNSGDLKPLFETEIIRTIRNLHLPTATIEAAIDQGDLRALDMNLNTPINDLELEKKSGDNATLFRVAIELALDTAIMMQPASKAQRGYSLINRAEPSAHKHSGLLLDKNSQTIESFHRIIADVLDHLRLNLHAARFGVPSGVHQIRVAIRRLRAALLVFRRLLHADTVDAYDNRLAYFGQVFGEARDWDVFVTETLPEAERDLPTASWLALVATAAIAKQTEAHARVKRELESRSFNSLVLSVMGWAEGQPSGHLLVASPRMLQPTRDIFPVLLSKIAETVDQRRRKLDGSDERLHALRKAAKKLRYAVEFSESLYAPKQVKKYLGPCKELQQQLGTINDTGVSHRLIATLVAERPALAPAVGELDVWLRQRRKAAEAHVPKLLRHLRGDNPFWT